MQILIDFDATLVKNDSPFVGEEIDGAVDVIKKLKKAGHFLILYTMRVDHQLDEAVQWCRERDIIFDAINCNPNYETGSRKIYAHMIIDDKCCGISLTSNHHRKPYVDWTVLDLIFKARGMYDTIDRNT